MPSARGSGLETYMKLALIGLTIFVSALPGWTQEAKPLDSAIAALSKFVGGEWKADGDMPITHRWEWNADKRGLNANNVIVMPGGKKMLSRVFIGWDPLAKKTYYLDMHDSEKTYHGHITEKDGVVEFRFGELGSGREDFIERGKFVGDDEWQAGLYQIRESKEVLIVSFKMRRSR